MRNALRTSILAGLAVLAASGPATVLAQKTCHLLIFADTLDPLIGDSIRIDASRVSSVFKANVAPKQLKVKRVSGRYLTRQKMLDTIRTHPMKSIDTLIVYFAGHGAYDQRQGHLLVASPKARGVQRFLRRSDVKRQMERRGVRLNILISDCCSNIIKLKKTLPPADLAFSAKAFEKKEILTSPAFVALCWKPKGFIDLNASARGQVAMGDDLAGGYFTRSLTSYLRDNRKRSFVTWRALHTSVRSATSQLFKKKNPRGVRYNASGRSVRQFDQTPTLETSSGGPPPDLDDLPPPIATGPRFGVRALERNGRLRITQVVPGSPATRVRLAGNPNPQKLEVNDILIEINGAPITTERQYADAVDRSGRRMKIRIINHRNGREYDLEVILAR